MYSCPILWTNSERNNFIKSIYNYDFLNWNAGTKWGISKNNPQQNCKNTKPSNKPTPNPTKKKTRQKTWTCYKKDPSASLSPILSLAHLFNIYYLTVIFNYLYEVE